MVDCSLMAIKTIAYIEINPYLCSGIVRYVIKGNAKLLFKGFNNDELDIITQANVSPNPILAGEQVQIKSNVSVSAVKLYDTSGLFVAELVVSDSSDGTFFTTIPAVVPTGLYYLHLYCEAEIITSKLYVY